MQKKFLVVAMAAALATPGMASAVEVAGKALEIYGQAHVSMDRATTYDATGASVSKLNMSSNSSRLGFKGQGDLTGGLTGFFKIEDAINFVNGDAAHTATAHRASILGLKGDFGTLELGYQDSLFKGTFGEFDVMFNSIGDSRNILDKGDFDVRTQNGIYYKSPSMSGFQVGVAYSTSWKNTTLVSQNNNNASLTDVVLSYKANGMFVTLGHESQNIAPTSATAAGGTATQKITGTRVVAGYKTGPMDIRAIYQRATNSGTAVNLGLNRNTYGAAFVYNVGGSIILQYMKAGKTELAAGADGATQVTVGYAYPLAKFSKVYVMYDRVNNDTNASYGIGNGHDLAYSNGVAGKSVSAISAGYIYKF